MPSSSAPSPIGCRIPPLVGYLLAGILVGPHTPGFVADQALAPELAEIGVILLMFGVGLHFSLKDLLSVRAIAIPGAVVQIVFATALGAGLALLMGWSLGAGLVFGLALSVASTVVLLRALQERRLIETERGRIAVGWLIVEDLAMVLALVLLPALASVLGGQMPRLPIRWRRASVSACRASSRVTFVKVGGVRRADAGRRAARDPLDPPCHRPHRIARAVPPRRARHRARRRLRRGQAVWRLASRWARSLPA